MSFIRKHPLFVLCTAFAAGALLSYHVGLAVKLVLSGAALLLISGSLVAARVTVRGRYLLPLLPAFAGILLAAVLSVCYIDIYADGIAERYNDAEAEITASVLYSKTSSGTVTARISIDSIDGERVSLRSKLFLGYPCDLSLGDRIALRVSFDKPERSLGFYRERDACFSDGIFVTAAALDDRVTYVGGELASPRFLIYRARAWISSLFRYRLGEDAGGFACGLLLGNGDEVPGTVKRDFRRLGLSHILAVSGLHLTVLCGILDIILKRLRASRAVSAALSCALVIFIIALTAAPPSIIRAGIMVILSRVGALFGRRGDPLSSLSAAAALILLITPGAVADVGFWLSVFATLGLILFASPIDAALLRLLPKKAAKLGAVKAISAILASTLAATAASFPVSYICFGELSLIAPIANVIFCYPFMLVLCLLPFVCLLAGVPVLEIPLCRVISGIISAFCSLAERLASNDGICVSLSYDFTPICILLGLCTLAVLAIILARRGMSVSAAIKASGISALAISVLCFFCGVGVYGYIMRDRAHINLFSYSKNDAAVISVNGHGMFIDCSTGGYTGFSLGTYYLQKYHHLDSFDAYLMTHYHRRHIESFARAADSFRIRTVLLPEPVGDADESVCYAITELAEARGCRVISYPRDGARIDFDTVSLNVAPTEHLRRSEHPLVALDIEAGGESLLYIGSSADEGDATRDFCAARQDAEVIYFGLHGPVRKNKAELAFGSTNIYYGSTPIAPTDGATAVAEGRVIDVRLG